MTFRTDLLHTVGEQWDYFDRDDGTKDHYVTVSGLDGKPYKVVKEVYGKYKRADRGILESDTARQL